MYRFIVDHRKARSKARPSSRRAHKRAQGFDLGAGEYSCVTCAHILPPGAVVPVWDYDRPYDEIPHLCGRFVDAVDGAPIECFAARCDDEICGLDAAGWEPSVESKADSRFVVEDLLDDAPPCSACFHYTESNDTGLLRDFRRCARYLDANSGEPFPAEAVRHDEALCGPAGAWFKRAEEAAYLEPAVQDWVDSTEQFIGED